jgi:hypothetical protein
MESVHDLFGLLAVGDCDEHSDLQITHVLELTQKTRLVVER